MGTMSGLLVQGLGLEPGAAWLAPLLLLGLVVLLSHAVEAITGFGCTLIAVALGALFLPIQALVPVLIPVNMALSAYLVARYLRDVDGALLLRRILPLAGLGLVLGYALFSLAASLRLDALFGAFVLLFSAIELWRLRRTRAAERPLGPLTGALWLLGGGVMHGLYLSGGPMIVYFASRCLHDKRRFRATLSALWLLLNAVLLVLHLWRGTANAGSLLVGLALLPPLVLGIVAGEALHARISERQFKVAVYGLLAAAGAALLI